MKILCKLSIFCLVATAGASLLAQGVAPGNRVAPPGNRAMRPERPQMGKVIAVDKEAKTVTVGTIEGAGGVQASNQVLRVATNTMILKAGTRVKLEDLTAGDMVRFRAARGENGKSVAAFLVVGGPRPIRGPTPGTNAVPPAKK